jgi:hypothetical protein
MWQMEWSNVSNNFLRTTDSFRAPNRREEVVSSLMRIGHTRLTHGHYLSKDSLNVCLSCTFDSILTIQHILIDCTALPPHLPCFLYY